MTTAIGHVKQVVISEADRAATTVELDDPAPKVANTVVNTVTGDTTVVYTGDFASDPGLMAMHKDALETARHIRAETIELIKKVISDLETVLNRQPDRP